MALAVDGPKHKATIQLLAPAYSQKEAESIWTVWASRLSPPLDHPLAEGTLLQETVLQNLLTPFPSTKLSREAAKKLVDDIAKAVTIQTFVTHTATDISDEEMEVTPCASLFDHM
jgi:hypothetical protein